MSELSLLESEADEAPVDVTTVKVAPEIRTDTLATSVLLMLALTVLQRGVGFARGVLFCRWLQPDQLGQWEMSLSFLMLAAPVVVLGLPGSFSRYLEYYRQRGQLRTFLRRTVIWTAVLASAATALLIVAAPWFSSLVFGRPDHVVLVRLMAGCLAVVIVQHFLEALFSAFRVYRVVSVMQLVHSLSFAALGLGLLFFWRVSPLSIVLAYGGACVVSSAGAIVRLRSVLQQVSLDTTSVPQSTFWMKLLPFAAWVWMTNLLTNVFGMVDRYMLIHFSNLPDPLAEVGNYHSSRVVPALLASVACLFGAMIMPYLSCDWEKGQRREVGNMLRLTIKVSGVLLLAASVGTLFVAPWLFGWAFAGKYAGGLAVLPWTLVGCVMFGMSVIAQNYLWCAERAGLSVSAIAFALLANVGLNLALVPQMGLLGAVVATAIANGMALLLILIANQGVGMRMDLGIWIACSSLVAVGFGLVPATLMLLGVLVLGFGTDWFVSTDERKRLKEVAAEQLSKCSRRLGRSA